MGNEFLQVLTLQLCACPNAHVVRISSPWDLYIIILGMAGKKSFASNSEIGHATNSSHGVAIEPQVNAIVKFSDICINIS